MAKIDTSKLTGFDALPEEVKAAIKAYDIPDPDYTGYVKKDVYDKAASDLAAAKKKLTDQLSQEDQLKQQREEELNTLRTEVETLKTEKQISANKASLIAIGYSEELAVATAQAMVKGEVETVIANQKTFLESHDKEYKAKLMGSGSTPPAGSATGTPDYKKQIEEAQNNNDLASLAYYTRLQAQDSNNSNKE